MESEAKICVSIGNVPVDTISVILDQVDMAEIRIDMAGLDTRELQTVFSSHKNLIATCREGEFDNEERARLLESAIKYGAAWVDIEADSDPLWRDRMVKTVKAAKCSLILSRHFYTHTPSPAELRKFVDEMFEMEADVVKIASQVNNTAEAAALLGLYADYKNIVSIGMGPVGVITRLAAPLLGAPFTFASFGDSPLTAAGQIEYKEVAELIDRITSYG